MHCQLPATFILKVAVVAAISDEHSVDVVTINVMNQVVTTLAINSARRAINSDEIDLNRSQFDKMPYEKLYEKPHL